VKNAGYQYSKQHAIKPKAKTFLKILVKNHSHKKRRRLPPHSQCQDHYYSLQFIYHVSDLSSGRKAAGNRLYQFLMLWECTLVSVATQGSPYVKHCYPTCSAISSGMCSKSVTSLKHQSHCDFADGL